MNASAKESIAKHGENISKLLKKYGWLAETEEAIQAIF
jgi:hypothetical protein